MNYFMDNTGICLRKIMAYTCDGQPTCNGPPGRNKRGFPWETALSLQSVSILR